MKKNIEIFIFDYKGLSIKAIIINAELKEFLLEKENLKIKKKIPLIEAFINAYRNVHGDQKWG